MLKVSIQIPTYEQPAYIEQALLSCMAQDYENLEINIVDDGFSDATEAIVRPYLNDPRVRYFKNKVNLGRMANYRHALYSCATGDWAVNLDGDDYYVDSSWISKAMRMVKDFENEKFEPRKDLVLVAFGAGSTVDGVTLKVAPMYIKAHVQHISGLNYALGYLDLGQFYQHFSVLYNRKLAMQTNFYSLNTLGGDTESILRLALKGQVMLCKSVAGAWRSHGGNVSYSLDVNGLEHEMQTFGAVALDMQALLPQQVVTAWYQRIFRYRLAGIISTNISIKSSFFENLSKLRSYPRFDVTYIKLLLKTLLPKKS
jgi:glycosyltransferase involved in cell wall biosynthesis